MSAYPDQLFNNPPFTAHDFGTGYACVLNRDGLNVLRFSDKPGACMTDPANAREIAERWNKEAEA
jgi:hypothetical protein